MHQASGTGPLPSAFQRLTAWRRARRDAGRMLLALDFDGTLAPIVDTPDQAVLPARTRHVLAQLLERADTVVAIISGRALSDVQARVDLAGVYFAGNHGLEIAGPGILRRHEKAAAARPAIERCGHALKARLAELEGVLVEEKGLTLSVHFRLAPDDDAASVIARTIAELCGDPGLRVTRGKKVFEIRPAVAWDKGAAMRYLLEALAPAPRTPVVFIGDDRTDEDAFLALPPDGDGVIVGHPPEGETAATSRLDSPQDVAALLEALASTEEDQP